MARYYVKRSSWFDAHRYDSTKIKRAISRAGGTNIRQSHAYGWSNQPKVVTFDAAPSAVSKIEKEVGRSLGTQWIIVLKKDW